MKKITAIATAFSLCVILIFSITTHSAGSEISADSQAIEIIPVSMPVVTYIPIEEISESSTEEIVKEELLSEEDISLIALVTMAEAEGECEKGKRLVIDTILNRMDSEYFPDTAYEVIYQPYQFSSMWNGRVDRCEVRDDICQLVKEDLTRWLLWPESVLSAVLPFYPVERSNNHGWNREPDIHARLCAGYKKKKTYYRGYLAERILTLRRISAYGNDNQERGG